MQSSSPRSNIKVGNFTFPPRGIVYERVILIAPRKSESNTPKNPHPRSFSTALIFQIQKVDRTIEGGGGVGVKEKRGIKVSE